MGSLIKELPRIEEHDWSCILKERLRHLGCGAVVFVLALNELWEPTD
jgi:hypothetical protein